MSKPQNEIRAWDSSNLSESFPGIVLPLTFSIARRGYELVYKSQAYASGFDWYKLEANHRTFNAMVGIFAGRMYYNLLNWYKFIGLFPNNSRNQKYLDEQMQTIGQAVYLPPQDYPLSHKFKFWLRAIWRTLFFEFEKRRYWQYLEKSFQKYEALPKQKNLVNQLERYAFLEQIVVPRMGKAVDNDFFVMTLHGILKKKLNSWLGKAEASKHNFLGALHDVISARQAILLTEIAQVINEDDHASRLLQADKIKELDSYLKTTEAQAFITEYRDKFLHRFADDQKIEAKNPMLQIDGFYGLIKTYTKLDTAAVMERQRHALVNDNQQNHKIINQIGLSHRITYGLLISRLKHHLRIREHNRLLRGKVYALLRELFIETGDTMVNMGLIDSAEDIYYLEIDELFQLIVGSGYGKSLQAVSDERKTQYESFKKLNAPVRFTTEGIITELPKAFSAIKKPQASIKADSLHGTIASPGVVEGRVIVLNEPIIPTEPFDILVVNHTDPGWTPLIALAKGLIVEHGGILSHAAIVTRELRIPSIIGIEDATAKLRTGQRVRLDATKGSVEIL